MVSAAKNYRLRRLLNWNTGRCVMVPMDHGITLGPLPGLCQIDRVTSLVSSGGADCVVVHKGQTRWIQGAISQHTGVVIHLSASVAGPNIDDKFQVCTVEEAVRLGADGVSVHVNVGSNSEATQIAHLATVAAECERWNLPLLAMMYVRRLGHSISNATDVAHAVRVAAELGADMVKCQYTGNTASFRKIVEGVSIPVLIAGGPRIDSERALLEVFAEAMLAGARGVAVGRNVFEHPQPENLTRQIVRIVHEQASIASCVDALKICERDSTPSVGHRKMDKVSTQAEKAPSHTSP